MDFYLFFGTIAATIFMVWGTIFYMVYGKIRVQENEIIVSPPSSFPHNWKHHVFPSFHGPDVRKSFLSHILKEFRSKGIDPFIDNGIERSKSIGPELIEAIRGSRIAIVLLSKNYASSTWCMNELVEIIKCRLELGQIVMTIFYEVEPTDVKKQTGHFGKVFKKTCKGKTKEDINRWRQALAEVATIAGEDSSKWENEAEMIEKIVTDVSNKLNHSTISMDFECLVGMETHMEKMRPLLRLDLDEVRMIGIWGPLGIGKTTIARFIFSQHSKDFQLSVFMENIKQTCTIPAFYNDYRAKLHLQEEFMSQITNQLDIKIPHLGIAKDRLKDKKVLVVLDDVDQLVQLEAMANETCWFGPWSRIIITTQDQKLLSACGINHVYKVAFPSSDEAFQMFCMYSFGQKSPKDGFRELAFEVTYLAGKLPLGLQIMGSYFHGMSKEDWSMELPRVRASLNEKIESILRFSYDALCDEDKKLFLYIACFFNHAKEKKVVGHLAKSFLNVTRGLQVLAEKSLISIDDDGVIQMHSLLVQLGKEIVRKQLGKRQFLVDEKDIVEVFTDPITITKSVIGIVFRDDLKEDMLNIGERAFEGMKNLQFLKLDGKTNIASLGCMKHWPMDGKTNITSSKLQLLHCEHWPMPSLPSIINLELLVELSMPHSHLEKLWEGIKLLRNLKWMDLSYSKNLKELPNLSTATDLRTLNLMKCSSLVELPSSIGNATNLQELNLSECSSLAELPSSIGNATNLQKLDLSECSSLMELPSSIGNATNLQELNLSECSSLAELPSSIGSATNLRRLYLSGCPSLVELPSSIGNATNLRILDLSGCLRLVELPSSIGNATNLQILDLSGCSSLVELPSSIGSATNLRRLYLSGCPSLVELPSSIGNATNLRILDLSGCLRLVELPSSIGNATNLQILDLSGCSSLVELPSSIGSATNLRKLDLSGCPSLVELPSSIGSTTNLRNLNLSRCSRLVELPSSIGNATNLQELYLSECSSLVELPSSIGNATNLQKLDLSECSNLVELPSSIWSATNLQILYLRGCSSLVELPSSIGNATNLEILYLSRCSSLVELPSSIGNATNLHKLDCSGCSSVVQLPSSIGNLHRLTKLNLKGCSKLKILPTNINLESLNNLNLTNCSSLIYFPEIPTNIRVLKLSGIAVEEVPTSIRSWPCLEELHMSYSENLKESPHAFDRITQLHLTDTRIQELSPWVKEFSRLRRLVLNEMQNLVSLSQLPDSLMFLNAENCAFLERLDCSFSNPDIRLNFPNCFKLNQEARDLIIQTSTRQYSVLPGGAVPAYFPYRAYKSSVTVNLNEQPRSKSIKFKACILLVNKSEDEGKLLDVFCRITSKQNALTSCSRYGYFLEPPFFSEHLYIFEVEAEEVTSTELDFEFTLKNYRDTCTWEINECGILKLLELQVDEDKSRILQHLEHQLDLEMNRSDWAV